MLNHANIKNSSIRNNFTIVVNHLYTIKANIEQNGFDIKRKFNFTITSNEQTITVNQILIVHKHRNQCKPNQTKPSPITNP